MRGRMRQIGLVTGLTVILTFPVTVISGAGSQKQSHHVVAAIGENRSDGGNRSGWHQHRDEVARSAMSHRIDR